MKKNLQIMFIIAACAMIFVCANDNFAQTRPIVGGGYKEVPATDAAVREAAEFAVSDHSQNNDVSLEIVQIVKAERQTVQGANYRMCIEVKVTEEDNEDTQFVLAVVYQNLKKELKLSSWKPDGCSPDN